MKNQLNAVFAAITAALLCFAPLAMAQTPDGQTPAEETVCDPLKEGGVTKGLYGLCVAFCEAQDHADPANPITEEEYQALTDSAPAGRILENYNKKKDKANNPADPDMPCIVIEEPCPCWTSSELDAIAASYDNSHQGDRCLTSTPPSSHNRLEILERGAGIQFVRVIDHQHNNPNYYGRGATCRYDSRTDTDNTTRRLRISPADFGACAAQVQNAQDLYGMNCTVVN